MGTPIVAVPSDVKTFCGLSQTFCIKHCVHIKEKLTIYHLGKLMVIFFVSFQDTEEKKFEFRLHWDILESSFDCNDTKEIFFQLSMF